MIIKIAIVNKMLAKIPITTPMMIGARVIDCDELSSIKDEFGVKDEFGEQLSTFPSKRDRRFPLSSFIKQPDFFPTVSLNVKVFIAKSFLFNVVFANNCFNFGSSF